MSRSFRPHFHVAPSDASDHRPWIAYLGAEHAEDSRSWRVSSCNLSQGGCILVGDFPNFLHQFRRWSRGNAFTVEVDPAVAKALGIPARHEHPALATHPQVQAGHRSFPVHRR